MVKVRYNLSTSLAARVRYKYWCIWLVAADVVAVATAGFFIQFLSFELTLALYHPFPCLLRWFSHSTLQIRGSLSFCLCICLRFVSFCSPSNMSVGIVAERFHIMLLPNPLFLMLLNLNFQTKWKRVTVYVLWVCVQHTYGESSVLFSCYVEMWYAIFEMVLLMWHIFCFCIWFSFPCSCSCSYFSSIRFIHLLTPYHLSNKVVVHIYTYIQINSISLKKPH